jgi:formamidopyrimidine-DNA glycosylase
LQRVGKRIAIGLEEDLWLVLHLMIAGRLHWRPPNAKLAGRQNLAADLPPVAGPVRNVSLSR